jgi:hypothetical protein
MKTSHFSENFDLCHPAVGSSEHSNNILTTNSNFSSDTAPKPGSLGTTATVNYSTPSTSSAIVAAYGSSSSDHQPSKYEKNANELLLKNQPRQQHQQQEQNKKRKLETGEYPKS